MADYSEFPWELYTDIELVMMGHESKRLGDDEFRIETLKELGRRAKKKAKEGHSDP